MSSPLWVRMELDPLPTTQFPAALVYWNPDSGELVGELVDAIQQLVADALKNGLTGHLAGMEFTSPLQKPSELAAILSQHWLVIPEPVAELPAFVVQGSDTVN